MDSELRFWSNFFFAVFAVFVVGIAAIFFDDTDLIECGKACGPGRFQRLSLAYKDEGGHAHPAVCECVGGEPPHTKVGLAP